MMVISKFTQLSIKITIKNRVLTGSELVDTITSVEKTITGKTNTLFKFNVKVNIPEASRNSAGYRFTIEKTSDDMTPLVLQKIFKQQDGLKLKTLLKHILELLYWLRS